MCFWLSWTSTYLYFTCQNHDLCPTRLIRSALTSASNSANKRHLQIKGWKDRMTDVFVFPLSPSFSVVVVFL